jgi:endonuclease I
MKKNYIYLFSAFCSVLMSFAQNGAPAAPYYNGFDWNLTGTSLRTALATKVISTHTNFLSYTPGVWNACKATDLDPTDATKVLLIYGFENGTDSDVTNDRTRSKDSNGGNSGQWNREHVYAKSLGTPSLDDGAPSDAGEDAHHLRSADVQRNSNRGNLRFAAGSGTSTTVIGGWYPGDEWKGDVARMMMYMYLRYGSQCLPSGVGTDATVASDPNMLNLFLEWNASDPVSQYEDNRNTYHGNTSNASAQGNRNPFIDNPYLATVIWGGTAAQNRWPNIFLSRDSFDIFSSVMVYPNPSSNNKININSNVILDEINVISINGQLIQVINKPNAIDNTYAIENLSKGFYFLKLSAENQSVVKKIMVN